MVGDCLGLPSRLEIAAVVVQATILARSGRLVEALSFRRSVQVLLREVRAVTQASTWRSRSCRRTLLSIGGIFAIRGYGFLGIREREQLRLTAADRENGQLLEYTLLECPLNDRRPLHPKPTVPREISTVCCRPPPFFDVRITAFASQLPIMANRSRHELESRPSCHEKWVQKEQEKSQSGSLVQAR